jgi:4-hydroxy-tetrahydrodipicolinate synthase
VSRTVVWVDAAGRSYRAVRRLPLVRTWGEPVAAGAPSTFVISITPFTASGALDEVALRGHLARMRDAGIGVYLAGSGSGEGYTLTPAELARVLEIGADELLGRVPVRAMGVEPRSAEQMIEIGRLTAATELDGMQLYSLDQGHGNRPTRRDLEAYLRDVLDAVTVPVVLSSHQSVGYALAPELIATMITDYDHVVGVNCTNPDITYVLRVIDAVDGRVDVHVGGPMQAIVCLALGGQGFLSSDGNLAPRLCVSVIDRFRSGDLAGCHDDYRTLMRLFAATRDLGGIVATKAALGLLGLPGGMPRRPRLPADDETTARVRRMLDDLALPELSPHSSV